LLPGFGSALLHHFSPAWLLGSAFALQPFGSWNPSRMVYSLYLHIPFCRHRCAYCDFNTYAGQEDVLPAYVEALCEEIRVAGGRSDGRHAPISVHTVFFGGGTPSLLTAAQFEQILSAIHSNFQLRAGAEITIEANPGTVSLEYLRELRGIGVLHQLWCAERNRDCAARREPLFLT
jgi:coproporphyrinogen III oxidase-like Fe-S oxidoreductase